MSIKSKIAAAAAAVVSLAPGFAAAQTWTEWTEADARALLEAENGVVTEVAPGPDGDLRIYATVDDWLNIALIGSDCTGSGAKRTCKSLGFNALFEVDDETRSRSLEGELDYQYVADVADGGDLLIHRQIELIGGASLANIRAQLNGFVLVSEMVHARIWPPKSGAASAKAVQPPP